MGTKHLTHGLVNVSYRYSTAMWLHETCLSVVIISCVWDVMVFLCFLRSHWSLNTIHIGKSLRNGLPRCLNICVDMGIPTSGCTVRFNPWDKNFVSGLRSSENQLQYSWLIVKLIPCLWVKKYKWSPWKSFLWPTAFWWAIMFYFMAKPSALIILCVSFSWMNILGGHGWHNILK